MEKVSKKRKRLGELLIDAGVITQSALEDALEVQKVQEKQLGQVLIDMGVASDEAIARAISTQLNIPFVRLKKADIPGDVIARVPPEMAEKYSLIPLKEARGKFVVTMANPLLYHAVNDLRFVIHMPVATAVSPMGDIQDALNRYYPKQDIQTAIEGMEDSIEEVDYIPQAKEEDKSDLDLANLAGKAPVIRFTNAILADSIRMRASDIHIEPQKSPEGKPELIVRCRVDGIMRETMRTDRHVHASLVSRIKVISGLDISIRQKPQDGKAQVKFGGAVYDLRVSTIPTTYGEKVTIRILNPESAQMNPEDLGFSDSHLSKIRDAIATPQGIFLVTGPTGSGKSSTLYACLNRLNTPLVNIITVEDPVEFDVAGINQVQINAKAGITFAAGLRSILRQDPDIVLVGEIRDGETAEIALEAAQTGHLVLSTLHTNDAPGAVSRLLNLGVDDFQISTALIAVVGQRLVRKIHGDCKTVEPPSERAAERIRPYFPGGTLPDFFKGAGCKGCFNSGYAGRMGLYEILVMTPALRNLVRPDVPAEELKDAARKEGYRTLSHDGIIKAARGLTSIEEVFRVAPPEIVAAGSTSVRPPRPVKPKRTAPSGTRAADAASPASEPLAFAYDETEDAPLVLAVDDNEIIRLTICDALESESYRVIAAEDGQEAVEMIALEKPDLIVTDYMMPRLDGIELIKRLKADNATAHIPIIMLTAKDDAESAMAVIRAGADDYLTKPVNRKRFLESVKKLL